MASVRRSLLWMAAGQGAFFTFQFAGSVILARILTPYEMGVFAVSMAVVGLVGIIQSIGLNSLLVRERDASRELRATAFTVNGVISILLCGSIVAIGLMGGALLKEPNVKTVLLVLALLPLIGQLAFLPNAMIERAGNFRAIAILKGVGSLISTSITVVLAFRGYSYMSLAYGQIIGGLINAIIVNIVGRSHISFRLSISEWPRIWRYGLHIAAISGVNRASMRLSEVMLGRILGISYLGLYSRASNLHNLLWDNLHSVITRVVFVDFADLTRRGIPLRDRYLQIVEIITASLWPAFAGVAILSSPLIYIIYGPQWTQASLPLSLLCIAAMLLISMTMTWELFVVSNETGRQARFEFIRTAVGLSLFIAACFHSLAAAAAARIGEALFAQFLYRPHIERMTQTSMKDFAPIYLRSASLTLAATLPAALLMFSYDWSPKTPFLYVGLAIISGILLWLAVLRIFRHPIYQQIMSIVAGRRMRSKGSEAANI